MTRNYQPEQVDENWLISKFCRSLLMESAILFPFFVISIDVRYYLLSNPPLYISSSI